MKIAMIGLGKMGANMTQRLLKGGHEVVAFDLTRRRSKQAARRAPDGDVFAEVTGSSTRRGRPG